MEYTDYEVPTSIQMTYCTDVLQYQIQMDWPSTLHCARGIIPTFITNPCELLVH
jgi:hypothetical protein